MLSSAGPCKTAPRLHFLKLVPGRRLEVEYETKSSSLLRKWGRISILLILVRVDPLQGRGLYHIHLPEFDIQCQNAFVMLCIFVLGMSCFHFHIFFYTLIHTIGYNFSSIISFSGKSLVLFPFPPMECYYDPFLQDWDNPLSCMEMYVFCRKGFHVAGIFLEPQRSKVWNYRKRGRVF